MIRKGIRNLCNGDDSTSTLNQEKPVEEEEDSDDEELLIKKKAGSLEEMILQLEINAATRKSKSILRSARNQYPRFSLDGKDALYRCSFEHPTPARHSVCCDGRERVMMGSYTGHPKKKLGMPGRLGGESVVWCNPGVIAKLMGLDAIPIPINNINPSFQTHHHKLDHTTTTTAAVRRTTPFISSNRNTINRINTR